MYSLHAEAYTGGISYNRFTELMQSNLMALTMFDKTFAIGESLSFCVTRANIDGREPLKNENFLKQIFGKLSPRNCNNYFL
ncbi:transposase [Riemerella anatipestifer]|uniref:transposase n=1 Tax=Riemerella anatipestifer TaxID=34085 RepID=UPI0021AB04F9|nr:transposase [Riemerella anatipestifer]